MLTQRLKTWIVPLTLFSVLLIGSTIVRAQSEPELSSLFIQVWPEFDRPETLMIYQGQLADTTIYPVTLTFDLPQGSTEINAVAIPSAEDGSLLTHSFDFENGELSFTLDQPQFQFEYYDSAVISKEGANRILELNLESQYRVASLRVEVQEPLAAQDMQLNPVADETGVGSEQLNYHIFRKANVAPGLLLDLTGSYTNPDDMLTTGLQVNIPPFAETPFSTGQNNDWTRYLGYVLVGGGVLILLVAGGIWYLNSTRRTEGETISSRRPPRKRGASKTTRQQKSQTPSSESQSDARFCHKCGTPYKPNAVFCHKCGAARR